MHEPATDAVVLRSFEVSPNPDLIVDSATPDCQVIRVNAALEALLGRDRGQIVGRPLVEVLGLTLGPRAIDFAARHDQVVQCRLAGREPSWCRLEVRPVPENGAAVRYALCSVHDVSRQVELQSANEQLQRLDPVTGLVRSFVLEAALMNALLQAARDGSRVLVCFVDVGGIGAINDTCSFETGDLLLRAIAARLMALVPGEDLVSRVGSNKFVVVLAGSAGDADQVDAGHRIGAMLRAPFTVNDLVLRVHTTIGVSCFPDTGSDVQELLHQAAAAARTARHGVGDDVQAFVPAQQGVLDTRLRLGSRLHGAVERGEMQLYFQPVVSVPKYRVAGMEALIRWQSPEFGLVMPDQFIPLAENFGMIAEIGRWVLQQGCLQARRWLDQGVGDFVMSVNVSGLQMQDCTLLQDVEQALTVAHLPARYLDLELTETAVMTDLEQADRQLGELRKLGVSLSLDDFGVGQSSLGYLQHLQVNRLKIDRSFVAAVPDDVKAARICRAVIGLAHEFGFSVVAEGVEQQVQLAFLERNGCECAQGYLFSNPLPADAMLAVLRDPVMRHPAAATGSGQGDDTVLLVDDEPNVLHALARLLRRDGYRILTAASFQAAFERLAAGNVQVVVSDYRMPDGKGTDFLSRVKATHPHTVRLILSGYADVAVVTEAINGGAVHKFLTKPWNDDTLRDAVRQAMRAARDAATPGN
ncbi:MAG TPA: EAL domain-containing protein [Rhodanobacteraceae bacterium]